VDQEEHLLVVILSLWDLNMLQLHSNGGVGSNFLLFQQCLLLRSQLVLRLFLFLVWLWLLLLRLGGRRAGFHGGGLCWRGWRWGWILIWLVLLRLLVCVFKDGSKVVVGLAPLVGKMSKKGKED